MRKLRVHEVALVILAALAIVAALKLAADFLVPVVSGILLAYALEPPVARLSRMRVPRGIAALVVVAGLTAAIGASAWWLRHDAAAVVAELPEAARKLRESVRADGTKGPLQHMRDAATELEKAADEATGKAATPKPAPPSVSDDLLRRLAAHGVDVIEMLAQLGIAITLALFLLAAGDTFRRKLMHLVGPSLAQRRVTIEILNEIDVQVQRYLLVMLATNVSIGLACWAGFAFVGLERPALWATVTGVLHFIPYVGGVLAIAIVAAAALIETGSIATMLWTVAVAFTIITIFGIGFNTWLQGRACRMNAVSVFVAVLLFGWLWGGWGLLLGAPLAAVMKAIADRVEGLKPFGQLLGPLPVRMEAPGASEETAERREADSPS